MGNDAYDGLATDTGVEKAQRKWGMIRRSRNMISWVRGKRLGVGWPGGGRSDGFGFGRGLLFYLSFIRGLIENDYFFIVSTSIVLCGGVTWSVLPRIPLLS
jgi:hypothetical protein